MGRYVVGVDGSPHVRAALRSALHEAHVHGSTVLAVHAYHTPIIGRETVESGSPTLDLAPSAQYLLDQETRAVLSEAGHNAPVEPLVVAEGSPARVLIAACQAEDTIVVGTRGHGGFAGLLLGSTAHQVLSHAPGVVVVTRVQ